MDRIYYNNSPYFLNVLGQSPSATAVLFGSEEYPNIRGQVNFYQTKFGVLVLSQVTGLPLNNSDCRKHIFALHIHSGNSCTGNKSDAFADSGTHYNPYDCAHPNHAGDLLPLWGNNGYAFEVFLTDRFRVNEIIGKTVIIHSGSDDFTTQPSGNSGNKIACGIVKRQLNAIY